MSEYERGRRDAFLEAAKMLEVSAQAIRLAAGEMTAGEMRVAKAVLGWKSRQMLERADG